MANLAELFGCTYVINLAERKDRLKAITHELDALGMDFSHPKVRLHPAARCVDHCGFPSSSVRGCFLSHLSILRAARSEGLPNVLIMEDDLSVSPLFKSHYRRMIEAVQDQRWGFLYFGHAEKLPMEIPQLIPYSAPLVTSHFYAVNATVFDRLIEYLEAVQLRAPGDPDGGPMHYDGALSMFRAANPDILTFIAHPSLGLQRSSRSDIHGNWYDKIAILSTTAEFARRVRSKYNDLKRSPTAVR